MHKDYLQENISKAKLYTTPLFIHSNVKKKKVKDWW